VRERLMI
jgi:hypothetical protein